MDEIEATTQRDSQDLKHSRDSDDGDMEPEKRARGDSPEDANIHLERLQSRARDAGFSTIDEAIAAAEKLAGQVADLKKREGAILLRLSARETDLQEAYAAAVELRAAAFPRRAQGRVSLLDPAVNRAFEKYRRDAKDAEEKSISTKQELEAVTFDSQSIAGKQLMARVRALLAENDEMARTLGEGRVQELMAEAALTREYIDELQRNIAESNEFVIALDAEVDTLQRALAAEKQQLESKAA